MRRTIIAGMTALALSASSFAYAQQQPAGQGPEHWRPSEADLKAFTDARIAALKAGLQFTPDQEKKWPPVEQAIREMAKARQEHMLKMRGEEKTHDAIARMRERADRLTQRAANLKKLADAAEPLYQTLSDDQKHRLRVLIPMLMRHHHHAHFAGWREHHGDGMR
jgi:hypothetical protein